MFPRQLVLVVLTLALALSTSSSARLQHRDHAVINRFIKRRSPYPQGDSPLIPVIGAAAPPPTSSTPSTPTPVPSSTHSQTTTEASSSTPSGILPISELTSLLVLTSSTDSTNSSATTTTTQPPSSTSTTSEVDNVTPTPHTSATTSKPATLTTLVDSSETPTGAPVSQSTAVKTKSITLTVLIVVASSLAALTILWTVFRKWKWGRSTQFDNRLNPVGWQTTGVEDSAIPGAHRRLSGSSFHSSAPHGSSAVHGYGSDSTHRLPDHNFTAGHATLAPVGGYADLARGPSPQPQMHQVGHAPRVMNSRYDASIPLHY